MTEERSTGSLYPVQKHWILVLGIVLVILPMISWPQAKPITGSSYRFAPDGYAAWFAEMARQGSPVQRWQQSETELTKLLSPPSTLIQVYGQPLESLSQQQHDWVSTGNTLVIMGYAAPTTAAPFRTQLTTAQGSVVIETTRRHTLHADETSLLEDEAGAIAWQWTEGKGRVIAVTTPFLAANAYQQPAGNFALLRHWILTRSTPVSGDLWIDEYLHGYRDPSGSLTTAPQQSVWSYLQQTPWLVIGAQAVIIALLGLWGHNRRFGSILPRPSPQRPNTEAYIEALASVLERADHRDFVLSQWGQAERVWIQQQLGLGSLPIEAPLLLTVWTEQTGHSAQELEEVLRWIPMTTHGGSPRRTPSDRELRQWLQQLAQVHQTLSSMKPITLVATGNPARVHTMT